MGDPYACAVIERYPDGTKWTHYLVTNAAAQTAIDEMGKAHEGRTYELVER